MEKRVILDRVYKSNLISRAKQIMFYLINRSNAEGTSFPSVRTIASDCGVSERTVQRTMKVLLEEGFVIKENRYRDNGGQSSNLYKLQISPKNNSDKKVNDEELIKEEKIELEEKQDNIVESIEIVTFDDYKRLEETEESNLNIGKQSTYNILVRKIAHGNNFDIEPKCHPMFFKSKIQKFSVMRVVPLFNIICHGVDDNLYPP